MHSDFYGYTLPMLAADTPVKCGVPPAKVPTKRELHAPYAGTVGHKAHHLVAAYSLAIQGVVEAPTGDTRLVDEPFRAGFRIRRER